MHTPDGFLTSWVCVATILISLGFIGFAVFKLREWMTKQKALLMAGLAATIFAFQMLNFSIGQGTSGHLIGGAIVALMLGPEAAVLVLTAVLGVQALVYGDGGVLAIGANILLMGVTAGYTAHYVNKALKSKVGSFSPFIAGLGSVVAASFIAALLLGMSGTVSFAKVIPAMVITHIFIGVGEGLITTAVLAYANRSEDALGANTKRAVTYIAFSTLCALAVMSLALPFASGSPDGLEKVALNLGFFESAREIYTISPMPDYTLLGSESYIFVWLSGLAGMALSFGLVYGALRPIVAKA